MPGPKRVPPVGYGSLSRAHCLLHRRRNDGIAFPEVPERNG